jgi:hypothetical protein
MLRRMISIMIILQEVTPYCNCALLSSVGDLPLFVLPLRLARAIESL